MFEQALRPDTLARLDTLVRDGVVQGFYLGGGTAVALHLGHRLSEDLDFFTPEGERIEAVHAYLAGRGAFILKKTAGSVTAAWEGVRLKSLAYFAEADREEEPLRMLRAVDWEAVKAFFRAEVRTLA